MLRAQQTDIGMWIFLLIAAGFLWGLVSNLQSDEFGLANAVLQVVILASSLGMFAFSRTNQRRDAAFCAWLASHSDEIVANGANYQGRMINASTKLTRYWVATSFFFISLQWKSRLCFEDEPHSKISVTCSAATVLFGIWGIPWGPVFTYRALMRNFDDGEKSTVQQLLSEIGALHLNKSHRIAS